MPSKKIISLSLILAGVGVLIGLTVMSWWRSRDPNAGLKIETTPPAIVFIDGKQSGSTPFQKVLKNGEVTVRLVPDSPGQTLPEYETKVRLTDQTYTVIKRNFGATDAATSGEVVTVEPLSGRNTALTVITTNPESASVTLDGQPQGFTSLSLSSIPAGDHVLTISAPGYASRTTSIKTTPGYKVVVTAQLAGSSQPATLQTLLALSPTPIPASASASVSPTPSLATITPAASPTPSPAAALPKPFVTIKSTPVGFLRVRQSPSSSSPEVGRVEPSQSFPLIGTSGDWYHIAVRLDATSSGWISSQYAAKSE